MLARLDKYALQRKVQMSEPCNFVTLRTEIGRKYALIPAHFQFHGMNSGACGNPGMPFCSILYKGFHFQHPEFGWSTVIRIEDFNDL